MKINYFDLLSPDPIYIKNIGGFISPKLKDISRIGYDVYQYYLAILLFDVQTYLKTIGCLQEYESLPDEEKININIFDLLIQNQQTRNILEEIFNFFIVSTVKYSDENSCFIVTKDKKQVGVITKDNYSIVCHIICQLNGVKIEHTEGLSKIKSKKALAIMKKIQEGRAKQKKQSKEDKNMELGNIISAVANKSQSLNILNIWDLTVFQIWDCFSRLSNNSIYDIQSMSVAVWGNKDNYFDTGSWFKKIETNN